MESAAWPCFTREPWAPSDEAIAASLPTHGHSGQGCEVVWRGLQTHSVPWRKDGARL